MNDKIPLVLSTDHNFIMPTYVAINSILRNANGSNYEINVIVAPDVTKKDQKDLKSLTLGTHSTLHIINSDISYENAYEVRGISKATYYRLRIPWLLPQYNKIIYLDGDIIVRSSLKALYETNIDNFYVGGVKDISKSKIYYSHTKQLGINNNQYINAGILLINSELMRKNELDTKFNELSKIQFLYQDQDIINLVCQNKIKYISPVYNFNVNSFYEWIHKSERIKELYKADYENVLNNLVVLHYCGDKPWKSYRSYFCFDWLIEYRRTPYYTSDFEYKFSNEALFDININKIKNIIHRHVDN